MTPILSIITINRNNAEGLRKTIESVLSQEYITPDQLEYIIIDGASSDDSVKVINEYLNNSKYSNKISYWISEPDTGIYNAMNKGIKKATGEYCLFLNSGDWLVNGNVIASSIVKFDETNIISGKLLFSDGQLIIPNNNPTIFDFINGYLPHPSTFIKTKLLKENLYNEEYKIISDHIFFFEEIVLKNVSYRTIDLLITEFDCDGISCNNGSLNQIEKEKYFNEILPSYVLKQYYKTQADSKATFYGKIVIKNPPLYFFTRILNKLIKNNTK